MRLPELPEDTWSRNDDRLPKASGEIVREMAERGDLNLHVSAPVARVMKQREADEHASRTLAAMGRLADQHRAGMLTLEEFARQALMLFPAR